MDQIIQIPLDDLHESPSNPRKHFDEAYLQDLAADIKAHGRVLSPLLVRPRVPALFRGTDDPNAATGHEIVFGHCRYRAARLAGLATVPCMVRSMDDLEVKRAQISENLQRKDVHPIEEAEGFQALITEHGETAETIAESIGGPSKLSFVYSRLKLLQAIPEIRDACLAGDIGSETALHITRYRHPKLQQSALGYIRAKCIDIKDGGKQSTRQIKDLLNERFTLDLKKAPFPVDVHLDFIHISGTCTACPKRSGNAPEFADILTEKKAHQWSSQNVGPDVCTDPDCFATKKEDWFKVQAKQLRAGKYKGAAYEIIEGNKARAAVGADGKVKGAYIELKGHRDQYDKARERAQANPSIPAPGIYVIQNPRDGKITEALKVSELVAAGARTADKPSSKVIDHDAKREADAEKAKVVSAGRLALLKAVRTAMHQTERSVFDMQLMARRAVQTVNYADKHTLATLWSEDDTEDLIERIDEMQPRELEHLLLDCALVKHVIVDQWNLSSLPSALDEAALHYGVSLGQPVPAPAKAPPPSPSATSGQRPVMYRNAATGETWSGRGLMPRWLKVAIDNGGKLADFVASTPSPAARAPSKPADASKPDNAAMPAALAQGQPADTAQPQTAKQPGGAAAQKVSVDAGSAGGASAQIDLLEGAGA